MLLLKCSVKVPGLGSNAMTGNIGMGGFSNSSGRAKPGTDLSKQNKPTTIMPHK